MQYEKLDNSDTRDPNFPSQDPAHIQSKERLSVPFGESVSVTDQKEIIADADNGKEERRKKYIKWGIICAISLCVLTLAIVLPIVLSRHDNPPTPPIPIPIIPENVNPYIPIPGSRKMSGAGVNVTGYLLVNVSNNQPVDLYERANKVAQKQFLQLAEDQKDTNKQIGIDWRTTKLFGPNNPIKGNLSYLIEAVSFTVARIVFTEGNATRFSIPQSFANKPTLDENFRLDMMGLQLTNDSEGIGFGFKFTDVADPTNVLLDTFNQTLLFADKYIQMDFKLPSQIVYGLGDRVKELRLSEGAFNMWSSGQDGVYDDGRGRGGLAGVNPFILIQTKNSQRYIGMYFRNSDAMTPILRFNNDSTSTLSFITIGGQLEVYYINVGTAHEVIQTYQNLVQKTNLPPFWALGWQEASPNPSPGGLNDQASVAAAINAYKNNNLPLEAVYLQSDSWNSKIDFLLNNTLFPNIGQLQQTLKDNNQRLVAYVDAAVSVIDRNNNPTYTKGAQVSAFIKSTIMTTNPGGYLVNMKNNKPVVYLDWLNDQCKDFWTQQVQEYQKNVPFDGVWTTMNEPFADDAGEVSPNSQSPNDQSTQQKKKLTNDGDYDQSWFSTLPLGSNSTYNLPFIPEFPTKGNYDQNSISLNGTHSTGDSEYDVHSLYSHGMMQATMKGVTDGNDLRCFGLTRGSFVGTGQYASVAHYNTPRSYDSLYFGLTSVLRSQMFGMSHSGADACGYYTGLTSQLDEELCLRWYQLATFFPLARHSQDPTSARTEPFNFKTYKTQVTKTMHDRMQYLRLMYTCIFQTSDSGGTCLDPLEFHFNISADQYRVSTNSFMFAGSIKVSPIMNATNGSATFQSYFPKGNWVNLADWSEVINGSDSLSTLKVRDTVNAHLAPGALIPFQNNTAMKFMTTADVLNASISLIANRDQNGYASGSLFLDQGISRSEYYNQNYEYYSVNVQANTIQFQPSDFNKGNQPHVLDKLIIVNAADLAEGSFACYYSPNSLVPQPLVTRYNTASMALEITSTNSQLKFSDILNVYYGSSNNQDVNMCDQHTFDYNIVGGIPAYQNAKSVTFNLTHSYNSQTLHNITMTIGFFDAGILNIRWTWADQSVQKRVPVSVPNTVWDQTPRDISKLLDTLGQFIVINNMPFSLQINARLTQTPEPIITLKSLLFNEYINWVNMQINAQPAATEEDFHGVFGLGERSTTDFFYKSGVYSLWSKDTGNPKENGKLPGKQVYGVHPFYMFKHAANSWVGVFHNLAQAQDWWIKNDYTSGNVSLSTIATGGLGDIYVMLSAPKPLSIIQKYHSLIGAPVMTPQWSLGWNQCKWCMRTVGEVEQSTQGYIDNNIPLDTQWVDIDYMQDYKDFTYNAQDAAGDPGLFAGLPAFINSLHQKDMKFVPIIDAGVAFRPDAGYQSFDQGVDQDVFMKINGNTFVGKVWPNQAVYPDWFHPNTSGWWSSQLSTLQKSIPFDGLWQDMNEASNFCNGNCDNSKPVSSPLYAKLPYTPTGEDLETKAIPLDVVHFNPNYTELDAHSLFGTQQVKASYDWFKSQNKRPFIISRSSFAGMGKYGSKWLGDNQASVEQMEMSVLGVMNMNIFGIPLVGADICGFGGAWTTPELCARWHAVGSFYPFSRNHRDCGGKPQEPWRFNTTIYSLSPYVTYTDLMRTSINRKYHLIRYYYSQMSQMSIGANTFYTIYKPLFFEFPEDKGAYTDIANNVMIGSAIKVSVNAKDLTAKLTDFYFPAGTWCSLFEPIGDCLYNDVGQAVQLGSQLHEYYAHIREGHIIPMQNATALKVRTTVDLQKQPVDLHILGTYNVPGIPSWVADGTYYNDDGETTNVTGNANQYYIKATYSQTVGEVLTIQVNSLQTATNFTNTTTNCSAVNNADWLQSIYIYNASSFMQHNSLVVSVAYDEDINNYQTLGVANYDAATDRFVYDGSILGRWVCLTHVFRIALKNLAS